MTMPTDSVCAFYQLGYWKFVDYCNKKLPDQTRKKPHCTIENCPKSHPRPCKYYVTTGYCKFGGLCTKQKSVSKPRNEVKAKKAGIQETLTKSHQELFKSPTEKKKT